MEFSIDKSLHAKKKQDCWHTLRNAITGSSCCCCGYWSVTEFIACAQAVNQNESLEDSLLWVTMHALLGMVVAKLLDIIVVLHAVLRNRIVVHVSHRHRTRRRLSSRIGRSRAGGWKEDLLGVLLIVVGLVGLRVRRIRWRGKIRRRGIRVRWRLRLVIGRILIAMEVVSFVVEVFVVIVVVAGSCAMATGVVVTCPLFGIIVSSEVVLLTAHHRPRSWIAIRGAALLVPVLPYWLRLGLGRWRQHILL